MPNTEKRCFVLMTKENLQLYNSIIEPVAANHGYTVTKVNTDNFEKSIETKLDQNTLDRSIAIIELDQDHKNLFYAGILRGLQVSGKNLRIIYLCKVEEYDNTKTHFEPEYEDIIIYKTSDYLKNLLSKKLHQTY